MTRFEYAVEKYKKRLSGQCPWWEQLGPDLDYNTLIKSISERIIGCRGITCEECWNQEYKESENIKNKS